jgi:NAD dependent epimerase/dehydratase family enzyme
MLGTAYHRPHWFPVPAPVLKLALGEMSELVLQGQRVLPAKALEHGFVFQYPELLSGLKSLKSKKSD